MSRSTVSAFPRGFFAACGIAAKRPHSLRRAIGTRAVCALLLCAFACCLAGCSNLGKYDEAGIARQAEQYYAEKYGERMSVTDIWEDRSYALFGYSSRDRAFCTMEDGTTVLVDFDEGVVGDTRQQDEITAAYEARFREVLAAGKARLEEAGFAVDSITINGVSPDDGGFLDECISSFTWQRNEDAEEEAGSFFYARYTGDERFFDEEATRVSLGVPSIVFEIAGADANYEHGFPVHVPDEPAWVAPIDETCRFLLALTDGDPTTKVSVYQADCAQETSGSDAQCGLLGELSPFDNVQETGTWLIVDWVPLGKGVYVTSDEHGVRLRAGDAVLKEAVAPYAFEELVSNGSLKQTESRTFYPDAFKTYELAVSDGFFTSLPSDVRDKGWFSIRIAYDNADPSTGLADLGIMPSELAPSLYTLRANAAAEDDEDEPPLDIGMMRMTTLENGFQYGSGTLYEGRAMVLARI